MAQIVILYYSERGHTKRLASAIGKGVLSTENSVVLIDISDLNVNTAKLLQQADGVLWGSPTFMGSMAAPMKAFIDNLSKSGLWTSQPLVDKMAGGFTVATYPSGDKLSTLMQFALISAQHGMLWVNHIGVGNRVSGDLVNPNPCGSWLGLMATSSSDKNQLIENDDYLTAVAFGKRFSNVVSRWVN